VKDAFHSCEVRANDGDRLRFVAFRHNCRPLVADFDVIAIAKPRKGPAYVVGEATLHDFERGLGVEALFSVILNSIGGDRAARDENGNEVPLPERTPDQWRELGRRYYAMAQECFEHVIAAPETLFAPPRVAAGGRTPKALRATRKENHEDVRETDRTR
jgi:hypothetical protein